MKELLGEVMKVGRRMSAAGFYACVLLALSFSFTRLFSTAYVNLGSIQLSRAVVPAAADFDLGLEPRRSGASWELSTAEEDFRLAIGWHSSNRQAHRNLGLVYLVRGDAQRAVATLLRAMGLGESDRITYLRLGSAYEALDLREEAIAVWRRARAGVYFRDRGAYFVSEQEYGKGVRYLATALDIDLNLTGTHYYLGVAYAGLGDMSQAAEAYRTEIRIGASRDAALYFRIGDELSKMGLWSDAAQAYRLALQVDPKQSNAHAGLGQALYRGWGDIDGASKELQFAIANDPNPIHWQIALGDIYREEREFGKAEQYYLQASILAPQIVAPVFLLAVTYYEQAEYDLAISYLQRAIVVDPSFANSYLLLGVIYSRQGAFFKAIPELEKAVRLAPSIPEYHLELGQVYWLTGRTGSAIAQFRRVLQLDPSNLQAQKALKELGVEGSDQ